MSSLEQTAKDTGSSTDLMDLKSISTTRVNMEPFNLCFKLSSTEANLTYYKLDEDTNKYYEFNFDSVTGEGARFSKRI